MEFKNTWNVWYHHMKDNWKLSGYRKIYNITNIKIFGNYIIIGIN